MERSWSAIAAASPEPEHHHPARPMQGPLQRQLFPVSFDPPSSAFIVEVSQNALFQTDELADLTVFLRFLEGKPPEIISRQPAHLSTGALDFVPSFLVVEGIENLFFPARLRLGIHV